MPRTTPGNRESAIRKRLLEYGRTVPQTVTLDDLSAVTTLRLFLGADPIVAACLPMAPSGEHALFDGLASGIGSILLFIGVSAASFGRPGENAAVRAAEGGDATRTNEEPVVRLRPLLAACHRALKHHGRIVVAVENPRYRVISRLRANLRGTTPTASPHVTRATGTSFSLHAVVGALRDAGFADLAVFSASPAAANPRDIRPINYPGTVSDTSGVLARLGWLSGNWLTPGHLVTANARASGGASVLDQIVEHVARSLAGRNDMTRWRLTRVAGSAKEKSIAFIQSDERQIVVRIPHSAAARTVEAKAHGLLEELKSNPGISGLVPDPIHSGAIDGRPFFAEGRVAGVPLAAALTDSNRAAYVREVDAFLHALNPGLAAGAAKPVQGDLAATIVQPMLDRVLACVGDAALRHSAQSLFDESLKGAVSRIGIVHGDFSARNIFVTSGRITGVIDWEDGLRDAPPVLDAFNYLDSVQRHRDLRLNLADTILLLATGGWPVAEEFDFLREFFRFCDIDFRYRRGFALLYWLYHAGPQLSFGQADGVPNRHVEEALRRFIG